jgi:hypothetical protein
MADWLLATRVTTIPVDAGGCWRLNPCFNGSGFVAMAWRNCSLKILVLRRRGLETLEDNDGYLWEASSMDVLRLEGSLPFTPCTLNKMPVNWLSVTCELGN